MTPHQATYSFLKLSVNERSAFLSKALNDIHLMSKHHQHTKILHHSPIPDLYILAIHVTYYSVDCIGKVGF